MRRIFKYTITELGTRVGIPAGAKILSVQNQNNCITIWVLCDPMKPDVERRFVVLPTGTELHDEVDRLVYVGTVQIGLLVWHVFEELKK